MQQYHKQIRKNSKTFLIINFIFQPSATPAHEPEIPEMEAPVPHEYEPSIGNLFYSITIIILVVSIFRIINCDLCINIIRTFRYDACHSWFSAFTSSRYGASHTW